MSDHRAWLSEWCPHCQAPPDARCRRWPRRSQHDPSVELHVARGWRARPCPTCKAAPSEYCRTPSGREASRPHTARLSPGARELLSRQAIWDELDRRGATGATVSFSGKAGRGGSITTITLDHLDGQEPRTVQWWDRDELAYALEGPVWDRFGGFAGQPSVRGAVRWTVPDWLVVITGQRGDRGFEEVVR